MITVLNVKCCDLCEKEKSISKFYGMDTTCNDCIESIINEDNKKVKEAWEYI